jgi:hypothetical protein
VPQILLHPSRPGIKGIPPPLSPLALKGLGELLSLLPGTLLRGTAGSESEEGLRPQPAPPRSREASPAAAGSRDKLSRWAGRRGRDDAAYRVRRAGRQAAARPTAASWYRGRRPCSLPTGGPAGSRGTARWRESAEGPQGGERGRESVRNPPRPARPASCPPAAAASSAEAEAAPPGDREGGVPRPAAPPPAPQPPPPPPRVVPPPALARPLPALGPRSPIPRPHPPAPPARAWLLRPPPHS